MALTTAPPETGSPAVQSGQPVRLEKVPNAPARARARENTRRAAELTLGRIRKLTGKGMLSAVPKSVLWQWNYARAGGWIPGEQAGWLEFLGRVYGFLIAVPTTALGFLTIWFVQRPTRVAGAIVLYFALRWAL